MPPPLVAAPHANRWLDGWMAEAVGSSAAWPLSQGGQWPAAAHAAASTVQLPAPVLLSTAHDWVGANVSGGVVF